MGTYMVKRFLLMLLTLGLFAFTRWQEARANRQKLVVEEQG